MRFLFLLVLLISSSLFAKDIRVVHRFCRMKPLGPYVELWREIPRDSKIWVWGVQIDTLETVFVSQEDVVCDERDRPLFEHSRYAELREWVLNRKRVMENDGLTRARAPIQGVYLTADLCPTSPEKFEWPFWHFVERIHRETKKTIPIGLAVSGAWLRQHDTHLAYILQLEKDGVIAITWINHSDDHPFAEGVAPDKNFILTAGHDPEREIIRVERELLKRGLIPSVFFRFPGLVSNADWIKRLDEHGLIPLGSDAWEAKLEHPKAGSVILVHANGNEPYGVRRLERDWPLIQKLGGFLPLRMIP